MSGEAREPHLSPSTSASTTPTSTRSPPTPRPSRSARLSGGKKLPPNPSLRTSAIEGTCLEELEKVWRELTASEMRLNMMNKLQKIRVGFNDIENFNLGLIYNSKTLNHENYIDKDDKKVVEAAMNFKRKDEIRNRMKLIGEKIKMRKKIE